ncbi:hypothetical protein PFDG_04365 [Plasmodium falciparum Dd2]|uniref:Uncharacterized protein n=1 Tax=Plasmodium falciparum (isolate Dd2) TaxID=57267 RepID=A0A0L7M568_PLAF4|nr:hypothetical protein PFDG_04365 [Plasmodium falciparum Dd2]
MITNKKNRTSKNKNYIINVNCYTWINNSQGLFDYESENFYKKCFRMKGLDNYYYILKDDINGEIQNEGEISKVRGNNNRLKLVWKSGDINNNYEVIPAVRR